MKFAFGWRERNQLSRRSLGAAAFDQLTMEPGAGVAPRPRRISALHPLRHQPPETPPRSLSPRPLRTCQSLNVGVVITAVKMIIKNGRKEKVMIQREDRCPPARLVEITITCHNQISASCSFGHLTRRGRKEKSRKRDK